MFILLLLILFLLITYGGAMLTGMALEVAGAVVGILLIVAVTLIRKRRRKG